MMSLGEILKFESEVDVPGLGLHESNGPVDLPLGSTDTDSELCTLSLFSGT
jgi:hypothetical protein